MVKVPSVHCILRIVFFVYLNNNILLKLLLLKLSLSQQNSCRTLTWSSGFATIMNLTLLEEFSALATDIPPNSRTFLAANITSQNYPSTYPLNYTGSWQASAPQDYPKVTLVITDIAIECDCYDCYDCGNETCSTVCDFARCDVCEFDKIEVCQTLNQARRGRVGAGAEWSQALHW